MPTFKLVRRPRRGAGAAGGKSVAREAALTAAAAVPDPIFPAAAAAAAAAVPDPAAASGVAHPAVSSKRHAVAHGGKKKKQKINHSEAATAAKKKSEGADPSSIGAAEQKTRTIRMAICCANGCRTASGEPRRAPNHSPYNPLVRLCKGCYGKEREQYNNETLRIQYGLQDQRETCQ